MSTSPENLDFIRKIIADDLASGKHETTVTRFPPEPNGYLHIGHAKAICLSFGIAQENAGSGARCHLRFDDTNPAKEETEYVESIIEDVKWLGFDYGEHLYFASDYFDFFYDCAVDLINNGKAYVDQQSSEEIKENRGNVTTPGTDSPYRDRPTEESLTLFAQMKEGRIPEGAAVLRAKIDMASPNMNLRDPILYRVMHVDHHRTGDQWKIYPMYDFAHTLEDALEKVTHSLCTLEFELHRPLYDWVAENCPIPAHPPRQIEFSKLMLSHTVMGKRKIREMVEEGIVAGWDDPRLPTLSAIRRLGYPPAAIRNLCHQVGITKFQGTTDIAVLEKCVRDDLNKSAQRRMGVLNPLKVVINNFDEGHPEGVLLCQANNNPEDSEAGTREVPLTREIYIERDDFMIEAPKKYFRLKPDGAVRLRGGYIILCTGYDTDADGQVTEVHVDYLPDTIGKSAPEGVKCKTAIHWVSAEHAVDAEIRLYDRLFTDEAPDDAEGGFRSCLNPDSLSVITQAKLEPSFAQVPAEFSCQLERIGYFTTDRHDHQPGERIVLNRTITLKDSWKK